MSTTLTIVNARPNHLPVVVTTQTQHLSERKKVVWVDVDVDTLQVGQAKTEMVYQGRRVIVEEKET